MLLELLEFPDEPRIAIGVRRRVSAAGRRGSAVGRVTRGGARVRKGERRARCIDRKRPAAKGRGAEPLCSLERRAASRRRSQCDFGCAVMCSSRRTVPGHWAARSVQQWLPGGSAARVAPARAGAAGTGCHSGRSGVGIDRKRTWPCARAAHSLPTCAPADRHGASPPEAERSFWKVPRDLSVAVEGRFVEWSSAQRTERRRVPTDGVTGGAVGRGKRA